MNLPSSCPRCSNPLSTFVVSKINNHILWLASISNNQVYLVSHHNPTVTLNLSINSLPTNCYFFTICNANAVTSYSPNNFDVSMATICYYHSFYLSVFDFIPNKECFNLSDIYCIIQFDHSQKCSNIWISHQNKIHMLNIPNIHSSWLKPNMSDQVLKKIKNLLILS